LVNLYNSVPNKGTLRSFGRYNIVKSGFEGR
jgi:hypothetical protein